MVRRATLELLRTLRRRDMRARARQVATAAEKRTEAERAAETARASRARAHADREDGVRGERAHVDAGVATAGELARAHHHHLGMEERAEHGQRDATRADEGAARALQKEQRAAVALEKAHAAQSRVSERIDDGVRGERARMERRDEEGILDAWNANRAKGRSPGQA